MNFEKRWNFDFDDIFIPVRESNSRSAVCEWFPVYSFLVDNDLKRVLSTPLSVLVSLHFSTNFTFKYLFIFFRTFTSSSCFRVEFQTDSERRRRRLADASNADVCLLTKVTRLFSQTKLVCEFSRDSTRAKFLFSSRFWLLRLRERTLKFISTIIFFFSDGVLKRGD